MCGCAAGRSARARLQSQRARGWWKVAFWLGMGATDARPRRSKKRAERSLLFFPCAAEAAIVCCCVSSSKPPWTPQGSVAWCEPHGAPLIAASTTLAYARRLGRSCLPRSARRRRGGALNSTAVPKTRATASIRVARRHTPLMLATWMTLLLPGAVGLLLAHPRPRAAHCGANTGARAAHRTTERCLRRAVFFLAAHIACSSTSFAKYNRSIPLLLSHFAAKARPSSRTKARRAEGAAPPQHTTARLWPARC